MTTPTATWAARVTRPATSRARSRPSSRASRCMSGHAARRRTALSSGPPALPRCRSRPCPPGTA
eukprot:6039484-Alexandrium_andersonii.AAC.1